VLQAASEKIAGLGAKMLAVPTDVSDEAAVNVPAAAAIDRFGAVHVVCNSAGVSTYAYPWFGPLLGAGLGCRRSPSAWHRQSDRSVLTGVRPLPFWAARTMLYPSYTRSKS
jgi:NAD(P)-dependent dehydrogenase (short-subunit alcohol dehydrogenase family)